MKRLLTVITICILQLNVSAQRNDTAEINNIITPEVGLLPLRFLASDELMGRSTLRPEINIAAKYIAETFRSFGVKEAPNTTDYFQPFEFTPRRRKSEEASETSAPAKVQAKNVIGWIEGTDPQLKDQFIVLTAHYDHLGVAKQAVTQDGKTDSIYNGARDNAIGVTAVMDAARYFSQRPPKRSVLFIAYAAEEMGEWGSKYFADNPVIPLKQMVYNLNIDNASYNDTTIVTVVGLGRTSADDDIKKACAAYGLTAVSDPAPEQNLFDRSDNVNLAVKGIPAPTFSLGFKSFDQEIMKYYHQLSDEVGNMNLNYAMKYIRSFILSAKNIADNTQQPTWKKGDKYEAAWKALY